MLRFIPFILFLVWFMTEFHAFGWLIDRYGLLAFLFELSASFMLGLYFIVKTPQTLLKDFQQKVNNGQLSHQTIFSPVKGLVGALLLIIPGLVSDIIGLILIFPLLIASFRDSSSANGSFESSVQNNKTGPYQQFRTQWSSDEVQSRFDKSDLTEHHDTEVVDAEIIEEPQSGSKS